MLDKVENNWVFLSVETVESMTDGGGDVMEKSQNGDFIGPQPQDNVSTIIQDTEMAEDEARSEATFRYTVTGFSKLKVGVS